VVACRTFEQPLFPSLAGRRYPRQHHTGLAFRTARALNRVQRKRRWCCIGHDALQVLARVQQPHSHRWMPKQDGDSQRYKTRPARVRSVPDQILQFRPRRGTSAINASYRAGSFPPKTSQTESPPGSPAERAFPTTSMSATRHRADDHSGSGLKLLRFVDVKKAHRCRDLTDAHQRALHARQAALT
jgi:hypothetical protein